MAFRAVEARGLLAEGLLASDGHVVDDLSRRVQSLVPRGGGSRNGGQKLGRREDAAAQIDRAKHPSSVLATPRHLGRVRLPRGLSRESLPRHR